MTSCPLGAEEEGEGLGSESLVKSEQANKSNTSRFPVAGAPLQAARTARRPPGARRTQLSALPPRPSPSDLPRSRGPGSAASARRPPPLPSARHPAAGPQPSARPLLPRGALPSLVPSLRAPAGSPRPGRAERGGGEGREERAGGGRQAGERRGAAWSPDFPEPARSAHSAALRVPAAPRRPAPPSCTSRGTPRPLPPAAATPGPAAAPQPLSATSPTLRTLPGRASSPHPCFLPAFPRARPPSPGLPLGSRLSPCPPRCAGASPCPVSPSHFLSRRPPLPRL